MRVAKLTKLNNGWASLGASFLVACVITTVSAAPLSWQLHIPEATDQGSQPTTETVTAPSKSVDVLEAQWRSGVVSQLLAKNLAEAQQQLNTAPTQGMPTAVLTSRAAWLLGLGLVPWAEHTLELASRQSSGLDATQQKALQQLKASFHVAYATQQSPMVLLKDCAAMLPALLAEKPNDKAYQQWQVLEGPERLSSAIQTQRQELAMLGFLQAGIQVDTPALAEEPLFPASLKPSFLDAIKTLQASQRVLNNAAGVVDIGLHQRRLTPTEYNHQCAELIDFLAKQQQRVAQYRGRLQQRVPAAPTGNTAWVPFKKALNESVALVTLHEAALAALRESIEAPFAGKLSSPSPSSSASIAKELPLLEVSVTQRLQEALNGWDSVSVAQAMLELGLPLSLPKALTLDTSRAIRMLTTPLPSSSEDRSAGKRTKAININAGDVEDNAKALEAPKAAKASGTKEK